ncbi:MAG: NAD(+) diphosphatase [Methanomicrobiales archaeon]|nr:NAD(+) diphosphatase [Methanomicrobiales archaeon]
MDYIKGEDSVFQDIQPHRYVNQYLHREPSSDDYIFLYQDGKALLEDIPDGATIPKYHTVHSLYPDCADNLIYLFSIDDHSFFMSFMQVQETANLHYQEIVPLGNLNPPWIAFAGATAYHLADWYDSHRYCGRCSLPMSHKENERAVQCPECGTVEYPKISPVIIVGVVDGDRLLLTKYATGSYRRYALIAGFMEIGETYEDAVRREVMEEVGLRVKNIQYYKSQPWGFSQSVLAGFFAELDGEQMVKIDAHELKEASWYSRENLPRDDTTLSLTWDMIEAFRASPSTARMRLP